VVRAKAKDTNGKRLATQQSVNGAVKVDTCTPEQLLDLIDERGKEVAIALAELRSTLPRG
jgi:hypothetical protein